MKKLLLVIWIISVFSTGVFAYNNISLSNTNRVNIMWNYILKDAMCKWVKQTLETSLWKKIISKVDRLWTEKIKSINKKLTAHPEKVRKVFNIILKRKLYIVAPLVDYLVSTQSRLGVTYKQFLLARKILYCQSSNNNHNSTQNTSTSTIHMNSRNTSTRKTSNVSPRNSSNVNPRNTSTSKVSSANTSKQTSTQTNQTNDMCALKFNDLKKMDSFTYENGKCLKVKTLQEKLKVLNTLKKRYWRR